MARKPIAADRQGNYDPAGVEPEMLKTLREQSTRRSAVQAITGTYRGAPDSIPRLKHLGDTTYQSIPKAEPAAPPGQTPIPPELKGKARQDWIDRNAEIFVRSVRNQGAPARRGR